MNVLSPGQVDTPNSQRLDKETRQMFESLIPRGKMGRPEEIATVALFLASDDSSYLNGWSCLSTAAFRPSEIGGSR
jgi:NAD(P)-dependent dehydrogenase (short-subunit alcohol dehydrogenase family)